MKYLSTFLNEEKISPSSQGKDPIKPIKPVKSVLSVGSPRGTEKFQSAQTPPSALPVNSLPDRSDHSCPTPHPVPAQKARTMYEELAEATPPSAALEVFPDWQGILVKSTVLGMSVWVVRDPLHGIALAKETGHPALLLGDVLKQKGQTAEEARATLLPLLIRVLH